MRRCDADLVDPELRRLVRVHVVEGRHHADDQAVLTRDDEMMALVGKELGGPARHEWAVEDVGGHVLKHGSIPGTAQ